MKSPAPRLRFAPGELGAEPFRLFFPAGVLAAVVGLLLWPLHLLDIAGPYPGPNHAHLMVCGFFGAFILGFAGTALPRMLAAPPLRTSFAFGLLLVHFAMTAAFAIGRSAVGNGLFILLTSLFALALLRRLLQRRDTPPPGFVLVALAFACGLAGAGIPLALGDGELDPFWQSLPRLLLYQGFVLLPVLGVGPFLLPRFFGLASLHDFPESAPAVPPGWSRLASLAALVGLLVVVSFVLEAAGWFRLAHLLRVAPSAGWLLAAVPFHRRSDTRNALTLSLRIAFAGIVSGYLAIAAFPQFRIGLLHLTLAGGLALLTLVVATRVVFGHTGHAPQLSARNRWLLVAVGLMLLATTTRISGDFWPKIQRSHYIYGALFWSAGLLVWAWYVLRHVGDRETPEQ